MLIPFIRDVGVSGGLQFNLPLVPINIFCFLPCFKVQMKFIFLGRAGGWEKGRKKGCGGANIIFKV